MNQGRRRMEGSGQNDNRNLRANSNVFWSVQFTQHVPKINGPNPTTAEKQVPKERLLLHGRHPHRDTRQPPVTQANHA